MGKSLRFVRPRRGYLHAGDSRLFGSLVLVALLGLHPGRAIAGSEGAARTAARPVSALQPAATHADADGGATAAAALEREAASGEVRYVAGWVATTGDNEALPYIIVDKVNARVYLFDVEGRLQGTAAALLGMEEGDGSAHGVGNRAMSAIGPDQRTTAAGRFVASLGRDLQGHDILWVDYDTALALHRVGKGTAAERRAQRLESPTSRDNRISYGCINVPVAFYEKFVAPAFRESSGVVYILPEKSMAREMFRPDMVKPEADSVHRGS